MKKTLLHILTYGLILSAALVLLFFILSLGSGGSPVLLQNSGDQGCWLDIAPQVLTQHAHQPLVGLLIQILSILILSRACAWVVRLFGQPRVIGEMIAGILLGKSVLALLWPAGYDFLFPEASMPQLYFFSQIGLIFFMFIVGLELRLSSLKRSASAAVVISHASILLPFLLGVLLALGLYQQYCPPGIAFSSFALFMGIAMSITAFPVLARIIQEKQLSGTSLGSMAIACAAIDDVTAWCLLAAVLGLVKAGSMKSAVVVLIMAIIYVLFMVKVIRPLAQRVLRHATVDGKTTSSQLAFIFAIGLGSALVSEVIGIHALFGAFLAGAIMPHQLTLRINLCAKIEHLTTVVLLPIFFTYTGIRVQIGLLDNWQAWQHCAAIIAVATVGKMVGAAVAARSKGIVWRDAWALGALMNTRGLMELVVLNIGYDIGILSPQIFAMLVVMALVTTFMTGPLLALILPGLRQKQRSHPYEMQAS